MFPYPWNDINSMLNEGRTRTSKVCQKNLHYLCTLKGCDCWHHAEQTDPTFRMSMRTVRAFAEKVVGHPVNGMDAVEIFFAYIKSAWSKDALGDYWHVASGLTCRPMYSWFVFVD